MPSQPSWQACKKTVKPRGRPIVAPARDQAGLDETQNGRHGTRKYKAELCEIETLVLVRLRLGYLYLQQAKGLLYSSSRQSIKL
jgi:hypothetical protein